MNLLLANDDGYQADGLKILAEKLSKQHNVYVVAPESNRSAVSQHISMFNSLSVRKVSDRVWACSGFPADCVAIGLISDLLDVKIDAVVSGINTGANLGTDILYSGTCAAAKQAILTKVPAIAVSLDPVDWEKANKEGYKFNALADFIANNLEKLVSLSRLDSPRMFVNVNGASIDSYKGYKFTNDLCLRDYEDKIKLTASENDINLYTSSFVPGSGETYSKENGDFRAVRDGFISISLVYADPVCSETVDGISLSL